MFIASKLLSFVTEPLVWVFLPLAIGLLLQWRRWYRTGVTLCWTALGLFLFIGWNGLPDNLVRQLEAQYPTVPEDASLHRYSGIVLLGGAMTHSAIWEDHGQVALNEQAERMTAAVALMRKHPHLTLVFSGGNADVRGIGWTEARRARMFFDAMGVDPSRILYEDRSRNTAENATLTARLAGVDPKAPWLLLTSANHMPRSMGVFRKAGWNVVAYPVDYRSIKHPHWMEFSLRAGANAWRIVLHENIGYWVYRWQGLI